MTRRYWTWLLGEILGIVLIAGPAVALVSLMWNRDERIIDDDLLCTQKDRRSIRLSIEGISGK